MKWYYIVGLILCFGYLHQQISEQRDRIVTLSCEIQYLEDNLRKEFKKQIDQIQRKMRLYS